MLSIPAAIASLTPFQVEQPNNQFKPYLVAYSIPAPEGLIKPTQAIVEPLNGYQGEIPDLIREVADKHGVDPHLALYIARLESNFNPIAKNPKSSATGLYQFLDSSWKAYCEGDRLDPRDNAECAMELLADGQIHHWTADPGTGDKLVEAGYVE